MNDLRTAALFLLLVAFVFLIGVWAGNLGGDQETFKDCQKVGQAKMAGGGYIKCEVLR